MEKYRKIKMPKGNNLEQEKYRKVDILAYLNSPKKYNL